MVKYKNNSGSQLNFELGGHDYVIEPGDEVTFPPAFEEILDKRGVLLEKVQGAAKGGDDEDDEKPKAKPAPSKPAEKPAASKVEDKPAK